MSSWDESDPLEILILASCKAFNNPMVQRGFVTSMSHCKIFTICGYGENAPAGTRTDTDIVEDFFYYSNNYGVVSAWKRANNVNGCENRWGALTYAGSDANRNFSMPGWGNNLGASRSGPIYRVRNQGADVIVEPLNMPASKKAAELPYQIRIAENPVSLNATALGDCEIRSKEGAMDIIYRIDKFEPTDTSLLVQKAHNAINQLDASSLVNDITPVFSQVTRAEVTETSIGEEEVIGCDLIYEQTFNGIPLHKNFLYVCVDKEGVSSICNKLRPLDLRESIHRSGAMMSVADAKASIPRGNEIALERSRYMYADTGNGIYTLCHELTTTDGLRYLVDTRTGEVK